MSVKAPWIHGLIRVFGLGTLLFGLAPALAPRWFGRLFDLPVSSDERLLVMVRSVGVRDATIGLGLLMAAPSPAAYGPWLTARIAADAGDTLAVGLAILRGARERRFIALGALALGATLTGLAMRRLTPVDAVVPLPAPLTTFNLALARGRARCAFGSLLDPNL